MNLISIVSYLEKKLLQVKEIGQVDKFIFLKMDDVLEQTNLIIIINNK